MGIWEGVEEGLEWESRISGRGERVGEKREWWRGKEWKNEWEWNNEWELERKEGRSRGRRRGIGRWSGRWIWR